MKRLFAGMLALLMLMSFVACEEEKKPKADTETETEEKEDGATEEKKTGGDETPAVGDNSKPEEKPVIKEGLAGTWMLYVDKGEYYRNLKEGDALWQMKEFLDLDAMKIRCVELVLKEDGTFTMKGDEARIKEDALERYAKPLLAAQDAYGKKYGTGKPTTEILGKTYDELIQEKVRSIMPSLYGSTIDYSGTWVKEGTTLKLNVRNILFPELQLNESGTAVVSYAYNSRTTFLAEKIG